ncbi:DUF3530 family protein [Aliikangiella sp. IMCC44359]|uniref:DUF3530 family protein n=1 Tax=Aliikangiella sp. IMCC44359 TaxID=3459125 RepID=UPI00403AD91E
MLTIHIKKVINLSAISFLPITLLLFTPILIGAEQATNTQQSENQAQPVAKEKKKLPFAVNINALSESANSDEKFWVNLDEEKLLVLKYWAKGKIKRGNLILLHTYGEHSTHARLVSPLTEQFSKLGWQVFVPNLPLEDYPFKNEQKIEESTTAENENADAEQTQQVASTNSSESSDTQKATQEEQPPIPSLYFFKDGKAFQSLFSNYLEQLISQIQPKSNNLVIVANENSAYWILELAKTNQTISQIVLLHPQLPNNVPSELKESFSGQTLPVYVFIQDADQSSAFIRAFDRNLWRTPFQRINYNNVSLPKVELENYNLSKMITGWVKTQEKN